MAQLSRAERYGDPVDEPTPMTMQEGPSLANNSITQATLQEDRSADEPSEEGGTLPSNIVRISIIQLPIWYLIHLSGEHSYLPMGIAMGCVFLLTCLYAYSYRATSKNKPEQRRTETKIEYFDSEVLGRGSGSTVVYKGAFGRLEVAVKKIPHFQSNKEAENEINFLIKCKGHPNIVQYYASEIQPDGYYLVLEFCQGRTLNDWVINQSFLPVEIDGLHILRQVTKGLQFLHSNNIVHRDLKPSNILFSVVGQNVFVKVSDFGISRLLVPGKYSRALTSFGGTRGWTPAEMLAAEKFYRKLGKWGAPEMPKMTKKVDIFSLGCVFYFVLTKGQHPFGKDGYLYDYNIKENHFQFESDEHCLRLRCNLTLIEKMIALDPNVRPDIKEIQAHPIFWSNQKILTFFVELSNFIHDAPPTDLVKTCTLNLEAKYFPIISQGINEGWFHCFDGQSKKPNEKTIFEKKVTTYKNSVEGLIRVIRNLNNHLDEKKNKKIKERTGEKPDAFMNFWLAKFPMLVNQAREAYRDLRGESIFKQFYE